MARRKGVSTSINLGGGVRVRLGTKSSSVSMGGKNGRVTLNSKGRRTTTLRAGGVSVTSSSTPVKGKQKQGATSPRPAAPATRSARLGPLVAPRRSIASGWVACDERAIVVHRAGQDDVRIPVVQVTQVWLEGKNLALKAQGHDPLYLQLTTLLTSWDMRFVNAVAKAAGLRPS
ncbi:DUF4236 domain-containing protein [Streptomyces sp. NPDC094038]|uniref:DUF4236 domain-containing protein n=1 Tax=Streptomyces sp. NPDC094038 TaxID=3366055 RepID=UPI0037FD5E28